jgi:hypothetical protein
MSKNDKSTERRDNLFAPRFEQHTAALALHIDPGEVQTHTTANHAEWKYRNTLNRQINPYLSMAPTWSERCFQ